MKCEIEFMPVGTGAKPGDAIVIRYGEPAAYELMIVDGGTLDTGRELVNHIRGTFGSQVVISHVVLTHPDADHASGLRTVLDELAVKNLWMHVPWVHAEAAGPYFANTNWTVEGLTTSLRQEYDLLAEIFDAAVRKRINIYEPFAGTTIGPFQILSPDRSVYDLLMPQFDRTPEPNRAAIEATGFWIGKTQRPGALGRLFEQAFAKIQQWVPESWASERLKDGGITSASNESSVVLYGAFEQGRVLLTGDAGIWALSLAAHRAEQLGFPLQSFSFVQIPHHGSRRNVGPTVLNRILGPLLLQGPQHRFWAFVSAPAEDDTHPRKMVTNAFMRRGGTVVATQGDRKIYYGGFPVRQGYGGAVPMSFAERVEEYD